MAKRDSSWRVSAWSENVLVVGVLVMVMQALGAAGPGAPSAAVISVPAGSTIQLELVDGLSTIALKRGDHFRVRVAKPLIVDGRILIPEGAPGAGEVVDAAASDKRGKPAKLLVTVRYVSVGDQRVALKAFKWAARMDDSDSFSPLGDGTVIGLMATHQFSGDIVLPPGTPAQAKVAAGVDLSPASTSEQPVAAR